MLFEVSVSIYNLQERVGLVSYDGLKAQKILQLLGVWTQKHKALQQLQLAFHHLLGPGVNFSSQVYKQ
ncbi:hypothetical protein BDBG_17424 [Blastomyces gilchristii SLH14081]|uniref:Uncharacterized protein n=1 Tax=Blastomyces gilchristii (strain SLH14081) TaxID=559298 RepID=A0A179US17_BLAGS|nr:uncharacterized protein BDBG_17424 [Blastomyces gilchristii SLH14081]OAT10886.1 hypothetical protein BDBG_17424 [Blastomyces gilchristii SLH14081]